jgi:glucan biosynthesis protein C
MAGRAIAWPRLAIGVHLVVVAVASWQLGGTHARLIVASWAIISGVSLFVLTGLVHEASHGLLARSAWLNECLGNLAGWALFTPLTAYRAFHLKHHQSTNRDGDPNAPLNSRWMLGFGSLVYVTLIHRYALITLRGRRLARYLFESAGMVLFVALLAFGLPRALRERAWLLPMGIVVLLQNIRIVTEHLDLPAGRYRDTWQLVLPAWLSRWLLHYDHHLEHHLRPGLHWHELPRYRAALIAREPEIALNRVRLGPFLAEVFARPPRAPGPPTSSDPADLGTSALGPNEGGSSSTRSSTRPAANRPRHRADAAPLKASSSGSEAPRYHGLDALRAATMLWVVVLHAALAYNQVPIPNLIWVVHDPAAHPALDVLCWWTLGISSPFFLMSGFFAAEIYQARGPRAFLVSRFKRIIVPSLAAGLIVLPATFFVWVGGWLISGQATVREFQRMKFHASGYQRNLFGPAHLWSLEYLAVMLAAFWILRELARLLRWRSAGLARAADRLAEWLTSPWRPVLLAVPTTLILWAGHRHLGIDAIMDRQNSFLPESYRLSHNLVFFAVGVVLQRSGHLFGRLATRPWTYLAWSIPVFAARAWLIGRDLAAPIRGPEAWALAATGSLFTWLITFGFLGLALSAFIRPRPIIRYVADSSYWVYLCHLPIVGLVQVDLYSIPLPAAVKFLVVLAVSLAIAMSSYQVMVRYTLIGRWLHGRRERPRPSSPSSPPIHRRFGRLPLAASRTSATERARP